MTLPPLSQLRNAGSTTDAPFSPFESLKQPARKVNTGVYVFAINPRDNSVHFAFGRKIPPGRRVPLGWLSTPPGRAFKAELASFGMRHLAQALQKYKPPLVGAAGTDEKYHGKWASLGGGSDKDAKTLIDAARIELNDEAAIRPPLQMNEIYLPNENRPFVHKTTRATLVGSDQISRTGHIFVFKWENFEDFMDLFPPANNHTVLRGGPHMAKASHGEIDYAQSFTPTEVIDHCNAAQASGHNFFTSYTMHSFKTVVMDIVKAHSEFLVKRKGRQPLNLREAAIRALIVPPDVTPRRPNGWRDAWIYVL